MDGYKKYMLRKLLWYLLTLVIAIVLNFILPRLIRGNPVDIIIQQYSTGMSDTDTMKRIYDSFIRQFGLDQPIIVQFFIYVKNIFRGDLGVSFLNYPRTISSILASAIPWTVALQLPAIIVGWILGNILGAVAAYKKGFFDRTIFPSALFLSSIPVFALSIILLYFFAIYLKWFPVGGGYSYQMIPSLSLSFIGSVIRHHTLPFISIVLFMVGGQAIGMRSMSIYELNADYVLYSKLMGIREGKIIRYVFRNAMLPQITGLALSIGMMVGGSLITEIVFNYPGIGTWLFRAIRQLDYPLISGCTLLITIGVLIANFIIEILYGFLDPRIKAAQQEGN